MSAKAILSASVSAPPAVYVEDVFSTFLYTGNGSTQTITNGIDLAGKGGLVWIKGRSVAYDHCLQDTTRGANKILFSNLTLAEQNDTNAITTFNSTGWDMGAESGINANNQTFASWTFREQPKFFDIVTWTGNDTPRTISHSLGSVPGCIIVKCVTSANTWVVYHQNLGNTSALYLDSTSGVDTGLTVWNSTSPTSTEFSLGGSGTVNGGSGRTYIAYLFAHNAGGFGTAGTDNVVSCGSFTTDGSGNATVDLGWEPQWVMMKNSQTGGNNWNMHDTMRGYNAASGSSSYNFLYANTSDAEVSGAGDYGGVTPTGFTVKSLSSSNSYIYIAIRRGPMKTPTVGTAVFSASTASTGNNTPGFVTDNLWTFYRGGGSGTEVRSRLQGNTPYLVTSSDAAEATGGNYKWDTNNGVNYTWGSPYIGYYFRRAPGFFDVVAYSGGGTSVNHNLRVIPELMFVKVRSTSSRNWVAARPGGIGGYLNTSAGFTAGDTFINLSDATTTTFPINGNPECGQSGQTYIAYLFATLAGVSKVGSYTGTGTTLQVNCGFTAGARFVLIKRTNSTGGWYVWDTARGIISGNDPYLLLNLTTAEDTSTDYIDPLSSGFEISSTAPAAINANGGSFIFLAIA